MRGLILAAGQGTRLRPLTERRSKPLLPLAGQPLITYPLEKLLHAGITEIGIVVGDNEAELRSGLRHLPADLSFIHQDNPLGLAHAVNCARAFCGADDFILLFCDNLFSEPLNPALVQWSALRNAHRDLGAMIHTIEVDDPRAFGVAVVDDDNWVTGLVEKPEKPLSNLAVVGIDFLTPEIFDAIGRIKPSFRGELEITDALAELVRMGRRVHARPLGGFWFDTGTFPDLLDVLKPLLDGIGSMEARGNCTGTELSGPVGIVKDSSAIDCHITGPVLIGADSRVSNSRLGPYVSVGDGCTLAGCTLSHCQVYPGTNLSGVHDSDAIFDGDLRIDRDSQPG